MKTFEPSITILSLLLSLSFVLYEANDPANVLELVVAPGDSIQEAINQAQEGATILIKKGTYVEKSYPIIVNKTVTIIGEGVDSTIIDGNNTKTSIFLVKSDGVKVRNLTVCNTFVDEWMVVAGVQLTGVKNVEIADTKIEKCMVGILLKNSTNNSIVRNIVTSNRLAGVRLGEHSLYNMIIGNIIFNNSWGIWIPDLTCKYNKFYHNNFLNNKKQFDLMGIGGVWDNGYPSGGNYWSDYVGVDEKHGSKQDRQGSDGIGDTSYEDLDRYPLMGPVYYFCVSFWNGKDYYVVVSSNSTFSGPSINPLAGPFIKFNITHSVGKSSFCRIIIPRQLLWVEDGRWTVKVNDEVANFVLIDESESENTYFYITFGSNAQIIEIWGTNIIPEFSAIAFITVAIALSAFAFTKWTKREN